MLDFSRTRIDMDHTREVPLLSTVSLTTEGLAMQLVMENGLEKCRPSNGTDAAIFLGLSWGNRLSAPATVARTEVVSVDAAGDVLLSKAPTGFADMSVFVGSDSTGTRLTGVAGPATLAGEFAIAADGRTLLTAQADGTVLFVTYRYSPSVAEAGTLFGENFPGAGAINTLLKTGLITRGWIYTDQFDTTVAWGTIVGDPLTVPAQALRAGTNGRITVGATGGALIRGNVIEAPSATSPWLGIYLPGV